MVREAIISDLEELKKLFYDTITVVCAKDYTEKQIKVWRKSVDHHDRWMRLLQEQYVLLVELDNMPIGFISLRKDGYLDFLYVHKDFQGRNIAKLLVQKIEDKAVEWGLNELTSDVSITAKPFFENKGFQVVQAQVVQREGVELKNFKMYKIIK